MANDDVTVELCDCMVYGLRQLWSETGRRLADISCIYSLTVTHRIPATWKYDCHIDLCSTWRLQSFVINVCLLVFVRYSTDKKLCAGNSYSTKYSHTQTDCNFTVTKHRSDDIHEAAVDSRMQQQAPHNGAKSGTHGTATPDWNATASAQYFVLDQNEVARDAHCNIWLHNGCCCCCCFDCHALYCYQ